MDPLVRYYKLKQKYNDNLTKRKNTIKKNENLTFKEKKANLKKIIGKCVNCGKTGGTIFEEKNGMLKAVCGNQQPCNLNINIKRKRYDNVMELERVFEKASESLKMRIIITKLDYLFGINSSKDDIVDKFNGLKKELAHISEIHLVNMKKYGDIIRGIPTDPLFNVASMDFAHEIDELKKIYEEYLENPTPAYITSIIEKYINTIRPLAEKIRTMKYSYYQLEKDGDGNGIGNNDDDKSSSQGKAVFTLVAKPYRLDQMEQERQ